LWLCGDWLQHAFGKRIGNGGNTKFWLEPWCGSSTLAESFPRLFKLTIHPEFDILSGEDCFFFGKMIFLASLLASTDSVPINNDEPSWFFRFYS
jgi:hypothetical protein